MRSIEGVLVADYLRRGWQGFLAAFLAMIGLPLLVFGGMWRDGGIAPDSEVAVGMHLVFTLTTGFVAACAVYIAEGSLARFYVHPISTSRLVACQMLLGWATIAILYLLTAAIVNLMGYPWPLWGPALFLATTLACSQAAIWALEGSTFGQLLGCLGTLIPLVTWFRLRYGALGEGDGVAMWNNPTGVEFLLLGGCAIASYGVAILGVQRTRRGDMLNFSRLLAWWETWRARRHTAPAPFASPLAAQLWCDWRQKIGAAPAALMGCLVAFLFGLRFTGYIDTRGMLELMFFMPLIIQAQMSPFLFGVVFGASGPRNRVQGMAHTLATRPVRDSVLATSILRTAALSLFLSWGVWVGGLLVAVGLAFLWKEDRQMDFLALTLPVRAWPAPWPGWIVIACMLPVSGTLTSCMATLVAAGRTWFWIAVIGGVVGLLGLYGGASHWAALHGTNVSALNDLAASMVGVALILLAASLFIAVRRKQLVSEAITWFSMLGWLALAGTMVYFAGMAPIFLFGGLLALPFIPLAGMPLAIYYNRHR